MIALRIQVFCYLVRAVCWLPFPLDLWVLRLANAVLRPVAEPTT